MGDLISRKAVIDIIHKEIDRTNSYSEHHTQINIEMAVEELPTAYDVEKVIAELRKTTTCARCLNKDNSTSHCATFCDLGKQLEKIRKGGVE